MRILPIIAILFIMGPVAIAARSAHVILPNGWSIGAPEGAVAVTATMPQGLALSPDHSHLAVVDSGAGPADLRIYDAPSLRQSGTVSLKGAFGKPVWEDDRYVWIALANAHAIARVDTQSATVQETIDMGSKTWPAALALSPDHARAVVSDDAGAQVLQVDLKRAVVLNHVPTEKHPGDVAYSPDGKWSAVAVRGSDTTLLFDSGMQRRGVFHIGSHPSALTFTPDNKVLFVAVADDDSLRLIDIANRTLDYRIHVGMSNSGASPNALTIGSDDTVYVSCGALDSVAAIRNGVLIGWIPSGWYADGVAIDNSRHVLYVLNGKGEGSHANPQFNPFRRGSSGYVAEALVGSVRAIALSSTPSATDVPTNMNASWKLPAATVVRAHGPIRHIIYVIKENRSYDQVLGDLAGGDGDPTLTIFGAQVTPNQHALTQRFGLFDRAFTNSQVSADGHNWTDAAFANDYLERFWPPEYGDRRDLYDFEDGATASVPHNGFLWDAAARAGITYRNYGEFVTNSKAPDGRVTTKMPNLRRHTSPYYAGFNLKVSDLARYAVWLREFRQFERNGNLPALEIVRLPNDHTAGTRPGALTPRAYVAQNDAAVGKLVATVSRSKYWKSTAIFIVEDDAQNGPDHVDAQRSTFYLASPYARGGVDHSHYSTTSVVHTIELLLGLKPLSIYDATARPMYAALRSAPDLRPFKSIAPQTAITAVNAATAYGAQRSARLDFTQADRADPNILNDLLYGSAKIRWSEAASRTLHGVVASDTANDEHGSYPRRLIGATGARDPRARQ